MLSEELDASSGLKELAGDVRFDIKSRLNDMMGDYESPYVKQILNDVLIDVTRLWMQLVNASETLIEIHDASKPDHKCSGACCSDS